MTDGPSDIARSLQALGWSNAFASQLDIEEFDTAMPARVLSTHRAALEVATQSGTLNVRMLAGVTVGDWVLLDQDSMTPLRILDRKSLLKRRAPGHGRDAQLIAANLDTLFIVSSCNDDFNPARLERYLALAAEAEVTPVIVLTKTDLAEDPASFRKTAEGLMPGLVVEALNAKNSDEAAALRGWCGEGQTVAFVGSSGVGKSTLLNALMGDEVAATQGVRTDDFKGRHTTTHRQMHALPGGGWLMDLPGMRELGMTDVADGIDTVFADLAELAFGCKFNDCAHESEPGCKIQAAIKAGQIEPDRLARWRKLLAEDLHNSATIAERHARDRAFTKGVKRAIAKKGR